MAREIAVDEVFAIIVGDVIVTLDLHRPIANYWALVAHWTAAHLKVSYRLSRTLLSTRFHCNFMRNISFQAIIESPVS